MAEGEIAGRITEVISQTGLDVKRDALIRGLSRGMKQRLGIARAIIHRPKVLLLDEPASGLDPKARFDLRNLLRALRDQGTPILISSHILPELEDLCTSIGIMEKGHLVRSGSIEEVTALDSGRSIHFGWVGGSVGALRSLLGSHARIANFQCDANEGSFQFARGDAELAEILDQLGRRWCASRYIQRDKAVRGRSIYEDLAARGDVMLRVWRNPEFVRHRRSELRQTRALAVIVLVVVICLLVGLACWISRQNTLEQTRRLAAQFDGQWNQRLTEMERRTLAEFWQLFYRVLMFIQAGILTFWSLLSCAQSISGRTRTQDMGYPAHHQANCC